MTEEHIEASLYRDRPWTRETTISMIPDIIQSSLHRPYCSLDPARMRMVPSTYVGDHVAAACTDVRGRAPWIRRRGIKEEMAWVSKEGVVSY